MTFRGRPQRVGELVREEIARNRSEALRDLIRDALVKEEWADPKASVAATVTLVYDHHTRTLTDRITEVQHDFGDMIVRPFYSWIIL